MEEALPVGRWLCRERGCAFRLSGLGAGSAGRASLLLPGPGHSRQGAFLWGGVCLEPLGGHCSGPEDWALSGVRVGQGQQLTDTLFLIWLSISVIAMTAGPSLCRPVG